MGMFPQLFMLGDVDLDWSMPEGHLLRFIQVEDDEMKGMLVCVPLKGRGRYRVATLAPPRLQAEIGSGPIPPGFSQEYDPPTLADIQAVLDELAPEGTTASNLRWSSIFRIKHGIVDRYRDGPGLRRRRRRAPAPAGGRPGHEHRHPGRVEPGLEAGPGGPRRGRSRRCSTATRPSAARPARRLSTARCGSPSPTRWTWRTSKSSSSPRCR